LICSLPEFASAARDATAMFLTVCAVRKAETWLDETAGLADVAGDVRVLGAGCATGAG
jgi:hypothetical protein